MPGERISSESLKIAKARELCAFLEMSGYSIREMDSAFRTSDGHEGVLLDVDVEVGQEPAHEIHQVEQIAILILYRG